MPRATGAFVFIFLLLVSSIASAESRSRKQRDEQQIRALFDTFGSGFQVKDVDKVMSIYEHSDRLVAFDMVPPLQYVGWDAYKKDYVEFFAMVEGPISEEALTSTTVVDGDLAAVYGTERVKATLKGGEKLDVEIRVTDLLRKTGGKWRIFHEHVSLPVDLSTGKAVYLSSAH